MARHRLALRNKSTELDAARGPLPTTWSMGAEMLTVRTEIGAELEGLLYVAGG